MEQEYNIKIEETSVNLGYVKKEVHEEELEFEEKQYKIALNFENIFGENLVEQRNNSNGLIGFLDGDVIMETGSVKLDDVKEENKNLTEKAIDQFNCNKCGGNYQGYCPDCSSLSHILNNVTPNVNPEPVLNNTPINMLEIREVSRRRGVFALRTLPKGIIIGPFEGIIPIESTTGLQWKIKNRKFANDQNGNWMKYIESVANNASKNLDVFQFDAVLYFETSREVQEGEELVVCYGVEEVLNSDKQEEFYLIPVKKEEYPKVFACTHCCLGFRLERCLVEHKSKCPQGNQGGSIEDFEIIECRCCKVWLEKQEHLKGHMLNCRENYNRLCHNMPHFQPNPADETDETQENCQISTAIDENKSYLTLTGVTHSKYSDRIGKAKKKRYFSEKKHKTNYKTSLKVHLNTHNGINSFECDICKKRFTQKSYLNRHVRNQHSNASDEYTCSECSYQTNCKSNLKLHLNTHSDIKPFECNVCKKGFNYKYSLKLHIRNEHSKTNEKEYKCSVCSYQTNRKACLKRHLNTHNDVKPFECHICKKRCSEKSNLKIHIKNKHSNTHNDIRPFECDICKKRFSHKNSLKFHIENKHLKTGEKEHKCSKCSYQTNYKGDLKTHLDKHNDIKKFVCDNCKKRFCRKSSLKEHVRNLHSSTSEKKYKCSECSYQTNHKGTLKAHLNTHNDIKPFQCAVCKKEFKHKINLKYHINTHNDMKPVECDVCKKKYIEKNNLKIHFEDTHLNTSEKKYKCSECIYQTNLKTFLKKCNCTGQS